MNVCVCTLVITFLLLLLIPGAGREEKKVYT